MDNLEYYLGRVIIGWFLFMLLYPILNAIVSRPYDDGMFQPMTPEEEFEFERQKAIMKANKAEVKRLKKERKNNYE